MTSVLRSVCSNSSLDTLSVVMLTYPLDPQNLSDSIYLPVPFTYNKQNGVLDFIFNSVFSSSTDIENGETVYLRPNSLGAIHKVNGIGPNMVAWLEDNVGVDQGSVSVTELPVVVRVNAINVAFQPNNDNAMKESTTEISFEKASGTNAEHYYSTYLFKKPLVVKYKKNGTTYYRMFTTQISPQT